MFSSKIQRHAKDKIQKKWKLFHATDFHSLMYPCFILCRILGIHPYKINASRFVISKPYYILSTIIICVCCVNSLIIIYGTTVSKVITFRDVTMNLKATSYFIFNGFIAIITNILNNPRMRLLQTIMEISSKLPSESYRKLSRLIHAKDIFSFVLIIMQGIILFFRVLIIEQNYYNILPMICGIYMCLLGLQIIMLYVNCVCVLKACFKNINYELTHMKRRIMDDINPSLICYMQKNQFLLTKLKDLKKEYLTISETVQMLNIIFSLQILVTVIMSFSNITLELYTYVVRWQNGLSISFDWNFLDMFLLSVTHNFIKIMVLVWACETGKNQAQEISTTVHDVLNSTRNEQIKIELQLFSLQILQRKNTFSAKGLTIDATLLTTMVGNITTYMLILIQFLITSHSCDG